MSDHAMLYFSSAVEQFAVVGEKREGSALSARGPLVQGCREVYSTGARRGCFKEGIREQAAYPAAGSRTAQVTAPLVDLALQSTAEVEEASRVRKQGSAKEQFWVWRKRLDCVLQFRRSQASLEDAEGSLLLHSKSGMRRHFDRLFHLPGPDAWQRFPYSRCAGVTSGVLDCERAHKLGQRTPNSSVPLERWSAAWAGVRRLRKL